MIGVAVSTWQAVRATRAELEQVQQRKLAEASEKTAISQKRIAIAIQNFLLRDLLRQADPWEQARAIRRLGGGIEVHENPTIKELLERASVELAPDKIETKFPGQPQVQVSILATMGDAFGGIGEYGKAEEFLSRASDLSRSAFGAENTNTLNTMHSLAWAYQRAGQLPQAIELFERVQATQVRMLGADHADMVLACFGLANKAKAATWNGYCEVTRVSFGLHGRSDWATTGVCLGVDASGNCSRQTDYNACLGAKAGPEKLGPCGQWTTKLPCSW